jgi:hypothetical protein
VKGCQIKDGARRTRRTPAGRQHHTGIQEQVHRPVRKRRIAASSSSIQARSCSSEKSRGPGSGENATASDGLVLTGDLLVPGTLKLVENGTRLRWDDCPQVL